MRRLSNLPLAAVLLLATCGLMVPSAKAQESNDLVLWYTRPASPQWTNLEALPIGSGRLGAMIFGNPAEERIQFNEDTLWTGKPHEYVREGAVQYLAAIQKGVFEGNSGGVNIRRDFLSDPIRQKAYQPFGDIYMTFPGHQQYTNYRRELNLNTAIATVSYTVGGVQYKREAIASYPDNAIAVHLTASQPGSITGTFALGTEHRQSKIGSAGNVITLNGVVLDPTNNNDPGLRFESRLMVINDGGTIAAADGGVRVEKANSVTLLLVAATSFVNYKDISADPAKRCEAYAAALKDKDFPKLLAAHEADFQPLMQRVKFDLGRTELANNATDARLGRISSASNGAAPRAGTELPDPSFITLYFQMGRYMLISSSRAGTQPANLQAVWNGLLDPPWESKYTTNINFEMNYWPAEPTNLEDCLGPFFDIVDDLEESGAITAKKQYGASGWVLHHNTDEWRGTAPINNIDGLSPIGGAWLCHHLWDHYLYSGDKEFLAKRAYPAMKGSCEFFLSFLIKDPTTGWLVTNPTHSPEQHPPGIDFLLSYGTTIDNQIIRSLFTYTIEATQVLGIDSDFAKKLEETRKQLPPNQIGQHGQLQEWITDLDTVKNPHRHMSPFWGLFPGWDITPDQTKVWAATKVLLTGRGDGDTGWSFGWRAALWARMLDGDMAYRQVVMQLGKKTFPNLFDKCGPFQVDGNFGSCAAMAEMLLQSHLRVPDTHTQIVDLLPSLPKAWAGTGSITGLLARGGFEVDIAWKDGKLTQAVIRSRLGQPCRVRFGDKTRDLKTEAGKSYVLDGDLKDAK